MCGGEHSPSSFSLIFFSPSLENAFIILHLVSFSCFSPSGSGNGGGICVCPFQPRLCVTLLLLPLPVLPPPLPLPLLPPLLLLLLLPPPSFPVKGNQRSGHTSASHPAKSLSQRERASERPDQ